MAGDGDHVAGKGQLQPVAIAFGKDEAHPGENMGPFAQLHYKVSGL